MPVWGALYFQNSLSPVMEQLIFFHDYTMLIMIMVMMLVGYLLLNMCFNLIYNLNLFEGQEMESIWTVLPGVFLLFIAFPSVHLLYLMEEYEYSELTIKVMSHQWFWSYEYSDFMLESFDSYMMEDSNLFRLLEVDNSLMLPLGSDVRLMVSSFDVIHSWTIPSMGVKVDAVPGRLNQLCMMFNRIGMFVGQCSEICGANHSFMPIVVTIVPRMNFLQQISV